MHASFSRTVVLKISIILDPDLTITRSAMDQEGAQFPEDLWSSFSEQLLPTVLSLFYNALGEKQP